MGWRFPPQLVPKCPPPNSISVRTVGSFSRRTNDPYLILGVPTSSSFRTVQKAFNKLAFQYHPDSTGGRTSITSTEFIRIRQAYERIRNSKIDKKSMNEEPDSTKIDPSTHALREIDFLDHFHRQTGVRLTSAQRHEIVQLYRSRVPGGFYGGHSWDLARRLVAEQDAFLRNMTHGGLNRREASFPQTGGGGVSGQADRSPTTSTLRRQRKR